MTTISQHVQALPGFNAEQKTAMELFMAGKLGKTTTNDATPDEFAAIRAEMGCQSAAKPQFVFLGFDSQPIVNGIAGAFAELTTMVNSGLAQVGVSWKASSSPYEKIFGKSAMRSGASYALRVAKVRQVLNDIGASVNNAWVIRNDSGAGDVASYSDGNKLQIGSKWPTGGGKFAAGVLIHEIGHWTGLVDVCSHCQAQELLKKHFQMYTTAGLKCSKNGPHGADAARNEGHFIGITRSKLLATTQKNLTVWNADSYRWYCSYFHQDDVAAGAALVTTKAISW
jgi:hypothetical protein